IAVPLDTNGASSILELSNTTNKLNKVAVTVYDSEGLKKLGMTLDLKANSSHHVIMDTVLNGKQGLAVVKGSQPEGLIATAMQYGRTPTNGINYLYGIRASEAVGQTLKGSYNTFLDQQCRLLLANPTS